MASFLTIRRGARADVPRYWALLDGATEWLVAQGRTDQWGTEPHSTEPAAGRADHRVRRRRRPVDRRDRPGGWSGRSRSASGDAVRAAATEPELYVRLLVTDRGVSRARASARNCSTTRVRWRARAGVDLLRVDCFAGGDGALVRYYEKQGFTRAEAFAVPVNDSSEWPGQILFQRL